MEYRGGHGMMRGMRGGSARKSVMSNPGAEGPRTGHKALSGARSDRTAMSGSPEKAKFYDKPPKFRRM